MADKVVASVRGGIVEKFGDGDRLTFTVASGKAATGGKLVKAVTGQDRQVEDATAGSLIVIGVALHDAAAGEKVTVASEGVWLLKANGSITAGAIVEAGSNGDARVIATVDLSGSVDPRAIVGRALADIANGELGPVRLGI